MDNESGSVPKRYLTTLLALVVCCITICILLISNTSGFGMSQIIPQIARQTMSGITICTNKVPLQTHISSADQVNHSGPWFSWSDKFKHLLENPIYKRYNITAPKSKEKRDLIYIVSSAPKRYERRQAIRDTWWPDCKPTKRVSVE